MDPKIAKRTQESLGRIIKRPPLTEKLLGKPPFRFLHDTMMSIIKTTGFMKGLFTAEEMNSDNVKDKDSKIAFLQKAVDIVSLVSGKQLLVKPSKVVAGHDPEKTNEFLQCLAEAITMKVNNEEYVQIVLKGKEGKSANSKKDKKRLKEDKDIDISRGKSEDQQQKKVSEKKSEKERNLEKGDKKDKSKHQESSRHKDENENKNEKVERQKGSRSHEKHTKKVKSEDKEEEETKENKSSENKEILSKEQKTEGPPFERMSRPTSAKGLRHRREDDLQQTKQLNQQQNGNQWSSVSKNSRPSSARPAPPKPRKSEVIESEPMIRLGSGKPNIVITDDTQNSEEDESFVVEDTTGPEFELQTTMKAEEENSTEHGGLVKKILETKKELEGGNLLQMQNKREFERPALNDGARRKERERVQKEIDKLRESIQTLTRSANPLGKIMDYIQEDLDSMQKEIDGWKQENKKHAQALKQEKEITEKAVEPLKAQLLELDQAVKDQLDLIAAVKGNIIRNDSKIEKLLHTIIKS